MALSPDPAQRERQISYYQMVREQLRQRIQSKIDMNTTLGISPPTFVHLTASEAEALDNLMPGQLGDSLAEWRNPAARIRGCRLIAPEDCV